MGGPLLWAVMGVWIPRAVQCQVPVDTVVGFELHSAFLVNLHHLLHAEARAYRNRLDTTRLSSSERAAWRSAVAYYAANLASRDLRTGEGMTAITALLGSAGANPPAGLTPPHRAALESAAHVYRKYRWNDDNAANRRYIDDVSVRIRRIAPRVIPRLVAFYGESWYTGLHPVRVDVVNVGAARGAYTWVSPRVQTVVDGAERSYQGWLGAEMLLHEGSHGLTRRLERLIDSTARTAQKDARLLWHVLQFFVVGQLTKETLAREGVSYVPYLYETGLFDRAWSRYRGAVERAMASYLRGDSSLEDAVTSIFREL